MKKILASILFTIALQTSVIAAEPYLFKTSPPFDISLIDGYQTTYNPGQHIQISVQGKSEVETSPQTGFAITATIYDIPRTGFISAQVGKYDENKSAWTVDIKAPTDTGRNYELQIRLYCSRDQSQCADIYGKAAHIEKLLPLKIETN